MRRTLTWGMGFTLLCTARVLSAAQAPAAEAAATTRILIPQLAQGAVMEVEAQLRARAGGPVQVEYLPMPVLTARLTAGDTADVAIISRANAQQLAARGRVRSTTDLVQSELGLAVADGAPTPVLRGADDLVAFLKATPSIALFAGNAGSGAQLRQFADKNGLLEVVQAKTVAVNEGFAATRVLDGRAASAVQQISELKFAGAKNIVPLPEAAQNRGITVVAVLNGAGRADVATRAAAVLSAPEAAAAYRRSGLAPVFGPPVRVMASKALRGALESLEPLLRSRAGAPVALEFMPMVELVARMERGDAADVVIVSQPAADQLAAKGRVASRVDLVESTVGIAVADGAPLPRMETPADLAAFLRATPSIALADAGGSSGLIRRFAEQSDLKEALARKTTLVHEGFTSAWVRDGRTAAAAEQLAELLYGGTTNIVPVPEAVQVRSVNVLVVLKGAQAEAAGRIAQALASADAAETYRRTRLTPLIQ